MTDNGPARADHFRYVYYQGRYAQGKLFAPAYLNRNNAGGTTLLATGMPVVDESMKLVGVVQHGADVGEWQRLIYGVNAYLTRPDTRGTIFGRNEEERCEACAQLAEFLMRKEPEVKILATSRVHLNLAGEINYSVPPLTLPDPEHPIVPSELENCEAVRLYVERAIAVQPAFILTNENAPAVAEICRQLDGIPLAVELAAARTKILSPDQIAAHLNDRFNLLTGGSRTALPRHQTLRATMDWSYGLLGESEKTLLRRLAEFPGSFTLEAVEEICNECHLVGWFLPCRSGQGNFSKYVRYCRGIEFSTR